MENVLSVENSMKLCKWAACLHWAPFVPIWASSSAKQKRKNFSSDRNEEPFGYVKSDVVESDSERKRSFRFGRSIFINDVNVPDRQFDVPNSLELHSLDESVVRLFVFSVCWERKRNAKEILFFFDEIFLYFRPLFLCEVVRSCGLPSFWLRAAPFHRVRRWTRRLKNRRERFSFGSNIFRRNSSNRFSERAKGKVRRSRLSLDEWKDSSTALRASVFLIETKSDRFFVDSFSLSTNLRSRQKRWSEDRGRPETTTMNKNQRSTFVATNFLTRAFGFR